MTVTNAVISTDQSTAQTTLSFAIIGQNTTNNVNDITVPKTALAYSVTPKVYVNDQVATNQGFSQDASNYYVWYKTVYSNYELSIVFARDESPAGVPIPVFLAIVLITILSLYCVSVVTKKSKQNSEKDLEYS